MTRRLAWFSAGVAAAPLAWGVCFLAYLELDDWLTGRRAGRRHLHHHKTTSPRSTP